MSKLSDQEYYRQRAISARKAAAASANSAIARIHQELADHYERLSRKKLVPSGLALPGTADDAD